jgi:hypothetical protein
MTDVERQPEPAAEAKEDRRRRYFGLSVQNLAMVLGAVITGSGMYFSLKDSSASIAATVADHTAALAKHDATQADQSNELQQLKDSLAAQAQQQQTMASTLAEQSKTIANMDRNVAVLLDRSDPTKHR